MKNKIYLYIYIMRYTRRRNNRKRSKRGGMFMSRQPAPAGVPEVKLNDEEMEIIDYLDRAIAAQTNEGIKQTLELEKELLIKNAENRAIIEGARAQLRQGDEVGRRLVQGSATQRTEDKEILNELAQMEKDDLEIRKTDLKNHFAPIMDEIKDFKPAEKIDYLSKDELWVEYKQVLGRIKKLEEQLATRSGGKKNKTRKVRRKKRKTCKKGKKCKKRRRTRRRR